MGVGRGRKIQTNLHAEILFIAYSHHVGGQISDHYWGKQGARYFLTVFQFVPPVCSPK